MQKFPVHHLNIQLIPAADYRYSDRHLADQIFSLPPLHVYCIYLRIPILHKINLLKCNFLCHT